MAAFERLFPGWLLIGAGLALMFAALSGGPSRAEATTVDLTIKLGGLNSGAVGVQPTGALCNVPPECTVPIPVGTRLTIVANVPWPSTPGTFSGGSGSAAGCATSVCTFTIRTASEITATFDSRLPAETLGVSLTGGGTGEVLAGNTRCAKMSAEPASCTSAWARGSVATLTPNPNTTASFRWLPGLCSGTGACQVPLETSRTVTGEFRESGTPGAVRLAVVKAGDGAGRVTSDPPGIACGADCTHRYSVGTRVTLTARSTPGSAFAGWRGAECGTAPTCSVTIRRDTTVTATFAVARRFALRVQKAGTGTGTVISEAPGIRCGPDCVHRYPDGARVRLTARAGRDSVFAGWSVAACGTGPTCRVVVNVATTVTATFNAIPPVTLAVEKLGPGAGTVTSDPPGIACGADCTAHVPARDVGNARGVTRAGLGVLRLGRGMYGHEFHVHGRDVRGSVGDGEIRAADGPAHGHHERNGERHDHQRSAGHRLWHRLRGTAAARHGGHADRYAGARIGLHGMDGRGMQRDRSVSHHAASCDIRCRNVRAAGDVRAHGEEDGRGAGPRHEPTERHQLRRGLRAAL